MNKLIIFFCLIMNVAAAQKMPDYGINKVHIYLEDKTLLFETIPVTSQPEIEPGKLYYWYSGNAVHQTQGGFSGKLLNGLYKEFYLDKNLKEEGQYKAGLKNGEWKTWAADGRLINTITWHSGIKSGSFALYDESGKISQTGSYNHNALDGVIKFYQGKDSVRMVRYKDGHIVPDRPPFLKRINIFRKKRTADTTKRQ